MTWKLTKIPKVLHTYWGATKLSWLRYLTVKSFSVTNPDWKIKVYTPITIFTQGYLWEQNIAPKREDNTVDWFPMLKTISNVEVIEVNCVEEGLGDIPDVFRSDLLRLKWLGTEGGLYSDMDVIHFRPLDEAYFNTDSNREVDTIVSYTYNNRHFSIGYLLGGTNNLFYSALYQRGLTRLATHGDRQTFGVILWGSLVKTDVDIRTQFPSLNVFNIDLTACYPFLYNTMSDILENNHDLSVTHPDCVALHYYAGHPDVAKWEHLLTPENYMKYTTTICNCIKKALSYEKI